MRVLPDKLYKYYGSLEYARLSIEKKGVFLDAPTNFNDPFDVTARINAVDTPKYKRWPLYYCIATFYLTNPDYLSKHLGAINFDETFAILKRISTTDENWLITKDKAINDFIEASHFTGIPKPDVLKGIEQRIPKGIINRQEEGSACKVSCFSAKKDSIPMWAYYGKSHTGVCIEYDLSLLDDNVKEKIQPVEYVDVRSSDLNYYQKYKAWEHEEEWRIKYEKSPKLDFCSFDCITAIYFGCNFDKSFLCVDPLCKDATNIKRIQEINNLISEIRKSERPIQVYRTRADDKKYQLNFERII